MFAEKFRELFQGGTACDQLDALINQEEDVDPQDLDALFGPKPEEADLSKAQQHTLINKVVRVERARATKYRNLIAPTGARFGSNWGAPRARLPGYGPHHAAASGLLHQFSAHRTNLALANCVKNRAHSLSPFQIENVLMHDTRKMPPRTPTKKTS
jgi:hypothetical protein